MVKIVRRRFLAVLAALVPVLTFRRSTTRPAAALAVPAKGREPLYGTYFKVGDEWHCRPSLTANLFAGRRHELTPSATVKTAEGAAAEGMMAPHEVAAKLAAMFDPRGVGAQRRAAAGDRPRLGDVVKKG